MIKLFEHKERADDRPAKHLDNTYDFYDRSSWSQVVQIRGTLNGWFDNYPKTDKSELKKRFQTSFSSAFYELFLHELFLRQGFSLEPHPKIQGTTKRPDFLVKSNGIEFYLEAKESTDKSDPEKSVENKINNLYDQINNVNSPNFFFRINELNLKSNNQPSGKKVIKFLENELPKYDPEIVTQQIKTGGFESLGEIIYEDNDLKLVISLIPKSSKNRGKEGLRPIGVYPVTITYGGADASIKSAIEKKATRYGVLDKPYLICINSTSWKMTDDDDVMDAIFGSLQITFSTDPNNRNERLERALDGVFKNSKGPKFTRVSGVLITNVHTANLYTAKHWLIKHPFAKQEIDFEKFRLTRTVVENNQIKTYAGETISEILGTSD